MAKLTSTMPNLQNVWYLKHMKKFVVYVESESGNREDILFRKSRVFPAWEKLRLADEKGVNVVEPIWLKL